MQGYVGSSSSGAPPTGFDNLNDPYLLVKRMTLERQRSLSNPYPYWAGRDSAPVVSTSNIVSDSPNPLSKLMSSVNDTPRQPPNPQSAELMSILQGLSERSAPGPNNGGAGWSNYPAQGGLDVLQNKSDLHHPQSFPPQSPFAMQKQRLQPQIPTSSINLLGQTIDNPTGVQALEKVLSSGLPQDPQVLSLLQQQYLLQLQSQATVPAQQLLLLDKLMLLKQQQKQEEQQQLLRQQQLLSQVLSDHQPHQLLSEQSYGQLQGAIPAGSASADPSRLQASQELFQTGLQIPVPKVQDDRSTDFLNLPSRASDVRHVANAETAFGHLPNQVFTPQKNWSSTLPDQIDDIHSKDMMVMNSDGSFPALKDMRNSPQEVPSLGSEPSVASDGNAPTLDEMSRDAIKTDENVGFPTFEGSVGSIPSERPDIFVSGPSAGTRENKLCQLENANDVKPQVGITLEQPQIDSKRDNDEPSVTAEVKGGEIREGRKASEKKSRKQKSNKSQSSEQGKGVARKPSLQQSQLSETEEQASVEIVDSLPVKSSPEMSSSNDVETTRSKDDSGQFVLQKTQIHQRAWKPAPGFKPKSLLEIQQEEQRRAHAENVVSDITTSVNTINLPSPWTGVLANSDPKVSYKDTGVVETNAEKTEGSPNTKSKKSQLHDLLAEEVLAKSNEKDVEVTDSMTNLLALQGQTSQTESTDDGSFIAAKESKKSRKKSAKARAAAAKVSATSSDVSVASSPIEKGKSSRQVQQEKEVLPAIPSGPSLGDFVLWKGESPNPAPAPAWSSDSKKLHKPTLLRDILKEQEKKISLTQPQHQIPAPQKPQPTQATDGANMSWSVSALPSKAASPIQINSQSKYKGDDDLFWGPIEQSKKETKQYDSKKEPKQYDSLFLKYLIFVY